MADWNLSIKERLRLIESVLELGITTFDHADIYGDYTCEKLFGEVMSHQKSIRNRIEIITKCGIKLISKNRPTHLSHHYDYSYSHIINSVEQSLQNFGTDHIDILLLHRPAPFFNPHDVAQAFHQLKKQGKVLHFGVSNFTPAQFEMLAAHCDQTLVTNQVELSPYCLTHFHNGNIDFFLKEGIKPMAWSPLTGGSFANNVSAKDRRIKKALLEVADELHEKHLEKIIYAWLLKHPAGIIPIVGSGKTDRIQFALDSLDLDMTLSQWYTIYTAASGTPVP